MMLAYPISPDSSGGLSISQDPEVDNVRALIDCLFYERALFPDYGIPISLFDSLSAEDIDLLRVSLTLQLSIWHTFITDAQLDISKVEEGLLYVDLKVQGVDRRVEL